MRHHILALLACASLVTAAEATPERITLADGRVMVGIYDAQKGVLTLTGKIKGAVPVKPEEIVDRKPAPPEPQVVKTDEDAAKEQEKTKRAAPAPVDPKLQVIEQQRTWINRKTTELKTYDSKIERTRRKIVDFRKQFAERAKAEGQYYDPERNEQRFLDEQTVTLPRSQANNSAVRGLVEECKNLIAKQKALDEELTNARKALTELEGSVAPAGADKPK
ncbi:MAG: hypothetical protein H0W78_11445 [Planctomycetes bacterium]|jgi:signal recognition particle GTPase|nr:hypothetical protein [Planctomycetota bacterium]